MRERIVFLQSKQTNIVQSVEDLVEILDLLPNLLELHTDFDDVDAEEFSQLVATMYPIQRLNEFDLKPREQQKKIEFAQVLQPNVVENEDEEAMELLQELANQDYKKKMEQDRRKIDLQAKSLVIETAPEDVKKHDIPDDVRERIRAELNPDTVKSKNSMLPELYKELYQKPITKQQVAHKFVNYEQADIAMLKNSVRRIVSDF